MKSGRTSIGTQPIKGSAAFARIVAMLWSPGAGTAMLSLTCGTVLRDAGNASVYPGEGVA
jgi:hypothetical protein